MSFERAAQQLREVSFRSELEVHEISPPEQVAAESIAFAANVIMGEVTSADKVDSPLGAGRLILLHDPASADQWGGPFRFVCFAQAPLELEIGTDPFIANVAWSWLIDALESQNVSFSNESGTTTKTISAGFGSLETSQDVAQIEIRASWTPENASFSGHAQAWGELLCLLAGLPHHEGVTSLIAQRNRRSTAGD